MEENKSVSELAQKLDDIEHYISQQGNIVTDLMIRITALEKCLVGSTTLPHLHYMNSIEEVRNEIIALLNKQLENSSKE